MMHRVCSPGRLLRLFGWDLGRKDLLDILAVFAPQHSNVCKAQVPSWSLPGLDVAGSML
jgi:hypothetical protein